MSNEYMEGQLTESCYLHDTTVIIWFIWQCWSGQALDELALFKQSNLFLLRVKVEIQVSVVQTISVLSRVINYASSFIS